MDPPRYTKDAKKKEEKEKLLQQEVQSTTYSTRSAVKKGNPQLGSPRAALPMSLEVAETPPELPSSKAADVSEGHAEAFEGEFEEKRRQDRQRRGKASAGTDEKDTLFLTDQTRPTGTFAHFTRGSAKKGTFNDCIYEPPILHSCICPICCFVLFGFDWCVLTLVMMK